MVDGYSTINIEVPELDAALDEYSGLLGAFAVDEASGAATLPLGNVSIRVLENRERGAAVIAGLTLWCPEPVPMPTNLRQLSLSQQAERAVSGSGTSTGIAAVDHVVLRTSDADDCIRLFGDDLGMRLALDQQVPEWGGRMLFFRCGKLTLEVIQGKDAPEEDHFWGITYLCDDLDATLSALDGAGVAHSGNRLGRKPGTRVATVKSHCLGIPTLLIGPDPDSA